MKQYRITLTALGLAALNGAAILGPVPAWAADPTKVLIKDFMFMPMALTVKTGSTVSWVNIDDEPHTIASDTGLLRSGALDTNDTFTYKFEKPGTYHIVRSIHPRMVATIVVE